MWQMMVTTVTECPYVLWFASPALICLAKQPIIVTDQTADSTYSVGWKAADKGWWVPTVQDIPQNHHQASLHRTALSFGTTFSQDWTFCIPVHKPNFWSAFWVKKWAAARTERNQTQLFWKCWKWYMLVCYWALKKWVWGPDISANCSTSQLKCLSVTISLFNNTLSALLMFICI